MHLHFYLKPPGRAAIARGDKTMPARVLAAVAGAGWTTSVHPEAEVPDIPHRDGFHMVLNLAPPAPHCLTLRPAGFSPFWQIETTNDRWDWQIARRSYRPPEIAQDRIDAFVASWARHLFGDLRGSTGGGILIPLQGKLTERRPFQSASPVVMIHETLKRWPDRPVRATLHPAETYSDAELAALEVFRRDFPNFSVGGDIASADLVVTENSTLAFKALFLGKPALLWARIDWHHGLPSVARDGMAALEEAERPRDIGRYLWWYRQQSLFGWDDTPAPILARLRALDWPI